MTIKHDEGKVRLDLVPMDAFNEVGKVYTWGHEVKGYGPENWKTVEPRDRYYAALMRHLVSWRLGEKKDKESGLFAMAHVIFNAMCLLWFDMQKVTKSVTTKEKTIFGVGRKCRDVGMFECSDIDCYYCGAEEKV